LFRDGQLGRTWHLRLAGTPGIGVAVKLRRKPVHELPIRRRYRFTLMNFPYYENWLIGTASELLRLFVIHLTQPKCQSCLLGVKKHRFNAQ